MTVKIELPEIGEAELTPTVMALLALIERLAGQAQEQAELIERLKDEIAVLKGEKKRPRFKPSRMDEKTKGDEGKGSSDGKRPESIKRSKTASLKVDDDQVVPPTEEVPEGSRFKGYQDWVVQDLEISVRVTRYRLERWVTPDGRTLSGQLPVSVNGGHFGADLVSYALYQHHQCHVTQPRLLEQLREWGVDVSAGQLDALLSKGKEAFHQEKEEVLRAGLQSASAITVDDSGARHDGRNGYVTQVGDEAFAWFASAERKDRVNFLGLLRAGDDSCRVDADALAYMRGHKLPQEPLRQLEGHPCKVLVGPDAWEAHLRELGIVQERHVRIAT
ncbi:MAG: transposase, partial [bacterium]|nr:transposase [bacterium]